MFEVLSIPAQKKQIMPEAQRPPEPIALLNGFSLRMRQEFSHAMNGLASVEAQENMPTGHLRSSTNIVRFLDVTCARSLAEFRKRITSATVAVIPQEFDDIETLFGQGFADYIRYPFVPAEVTRRFCALINQPETSTPQAPEACLATRARVLLEADLSRPVSLDQLVAEMGTNRTTLNDAFKALFGVGPMTWLRGRRCAEAARLLRTGTDSVLNIALSVGYGDANNFSTAFRKTYDCSPLAYRKIVRCKDSTIACKGMPLSRLIP